MYGRRTSPWFALFVFVPVVVLLGWALVEGGTFRKRASVSVACELDGLGHGFCSFTNRPDSRPGSACVYVQAVRLEDGERSEPAKVCSGMVDSATTVDVSWTVPGVPALCAREGQNWRDSCGMAIRPTVSR